jgi:hypothetical protein
MLGFGIEVEDEHWDRKLWFIFIKLKNRNDWMLRNNRIRPLCLLRLHASQCGFIREAMKGTEVLLLWTKQR